MNKFYVTTPIYYVNDVPHIGHAYTTLQADAVARAARLLLGDANVWFLTGTDEHGSKVAKAAEQAGIEVKEFVDKYADAFKQTWKKLNISHNDFIRTTEARHEAGVKQILSQLKTIKNNQSVVYEGVYEGLYCEGCEQFYTADELTDGLCPIHKKPAILLKEKNWFFRLSSYLDEIEKDVRDDIIKIIPEKRKNEVLGLIKQLRQLPNGGDFSISRETVKWGIDLPAEYGSGQKAYVWVDALTNYITALGYGSADDGLFKKFWQDKTSSVVHYLGQDILKFHAVYWPGLLLALGLFNFDQQRPLELRIHGYFTINGEKMSKSLGNVISPDELINRYGLEAARWLLISTFPFGSESDFSFTKFDEKYNAELANLLGNHISRVSNLVEKLCGGKISGTYDKNKATHHKDSNDQWEICLNILAGLHEQSEKLHLEQPWKSITAEPDKAIKAINDAALYIRDVLADQLKPLVPDTAREIKNTFSSENVKKAEALFPRLAK